MSFTPYRLDSDTSTRADEIDSLERRAILAGAVAGSIGDLVKMLYTTAIGGGYVANSFASYLIDAWIRIVALRPQAATFFSIGSAPAWAANAVLYDTGAMVAKEYELELTILVNIRDINGWSLRLQHRNAADTANIRQSRLTVASQEVNNTVQERKRRWPRFTVATNERIRIVEGAGVPASNPFTAADWELFIRPV